IQRARENDVVTAVADKFSAPTYTIDAASWLRLAIDKSANGILHLANNGGCSWQEWAQYAIDVCRSLGLPLKAERVGAVSLADMKNFVAQRPVYTVLSIAKFTALTGFQPRHWREALAAYISAHAKRAGCSWSEGRDYCHLYHWRPHRHASQDRYSSDRRSRALQYCAYA